ncbi:hypothetical protein [Subtercola sp. YIM 133946]|uniref:hypothetical protein n=1 Tax=Subtercola sp. YIM 133946 TaxID=3118909 RepID=UPI002F931D69
MLTSKSRADGPPIRAFDTPVRVPSRRSAAIVVTLATWALLVVTVPLYFVFLLNNLQDVFAIVANMRAPAGHATDDTALDTDEATAD